MLTSGAVRSIVRLVAALGTAGTFLPLQFGRWPIFVPLEWLVAIKLFFFATSRLIERFGDSRSAEVLLGTALAAVFGGVALFLGGSALVGQICGAFGLVLAGLAVLTFFKSLRHLGPTMPLVFVLVFGSLLLNGSLFSDLPWVTAGLLWIAPSGSLIGVPATLGTKRRALLLLVRGLVVLLVIGLGFFALFLIAPPGNEY